MAPLLLYALIGTLLEWLLLRQFLEMPPVRLLGRVFLLNVLGGSVVLIAALMQFLYGEWLFLHSWGTRDIFLFTAAVELPMAWMILPRLPFTKFFSLVVIGNFLTALMATLLLWAVPGFIGASYLQPATHEAEVISGGYLIRSAVEKFRTNHGGEVPTYLYGGDAGSWRYQDHGDRLLQEGLLEVYPKNPLHLGRGFLQGRQDWTLVGLFLGRKLPAYQHLRKTWVGITSGGHEPRFGIQGIRMGNLLSDPSLPLSNRPHTYQFGWEGERMPGSFFYRSYDLDHDGKRESYVLGVIGAEGTSGEDRYDANSNRLIHEVEEGQWEPATDGVADGILWAAGGGLLQGLYD